MKGTWNVTASWAGSETHEAAVSPTVSFTVKEKEEMAAPSPDRLEPLFETTRVPNA